MDQVVWEGPEEVAVKAALATSCEYILALAVFAGLLPCGLTRAVNYTYLPLGSPRKCLL